MRLVLLLFILLLINCTTENTESNITVDQNINKAGATFSGETSSGILINN